MTRETKRQQQNSSDRENNERGLRKANYKNNKRLNTKQRKEKKKKILNRTENNNNKIKCEWQFWDHTHMICVAIVEWFSLSRSLIVIGSLLCKTTNIYNTKHLTFRSMSGLACIAFQGIKSKYSTGIWRIYQIHQLYGCKQLKLVTWNEWKEVKKINTQTNTYTHICMLVVKNIRFL